MVAIHDPSTRIIIPFQKRFKTIANNEIITTLKITLNIRLLDIEGAEFNVLPSLIPWLKAQRPALFLSTHAPFLDADVRQARMAALAESLSFYGECRDDKGKLLDAADLTGPSVLERFPTFLFTG